MKKETEETYLTNEEIVDCLKSIANGNMASFSDERILQIQEALDRVRKEMKDEWQKGRH